jgi:hypothetical protein
MLDEMRKSLSHVVSERMTSPVFGTFVISWMGFNWKVLFFALSSSIDTVKKIALIDNTLNRRYSVIYPIISTIILVVVYPWVAMAGFIVWEHAKNIKVSLKNYLGRKVLLTRAQSLSLRLEMKNIEEKYNALLEEEKSNLSKNKFALAEKEKEIESMASKLSSLQNAINGMNKKLEREREVGENELKILNELYTAGERTVPIEDIIVRNKMDRSQIYLHIDKLSELQMVNREGAGLRIGSIGRKLVYDRRNETQAS